jgi:phage shock protein PspC (stress-responsive transcriptional regulator)
MEKVINVGIGGRSFVIDSDAYDKLDSYLHQFRSKISMGNGQVMDVLDDLECRIAALFSERLRERNREVIDITLVDAAISQFGMPDGSKFVYDGYSPEEECNFAKSADNGVRKLYRDPANKAIGGVCSGLANYLGLDITLVRALFVLGLIMGTASFWLYVIMWLIVPLDRV